VPLDASLIDSQLAYRTTPPRVAFNPEDPRLAIVAMEVLIVWG
jgi:hypothetical protein